MTDDVKPQEGPQTIQLSKPINIDGVPVSSLQMREPTVEDQLANDTMKGTPVEKELALLANLCMVKPADLRGLTLRNYKRLQETLVGFLD